MSMLFNMLSRLVITFLPRSKRLLISWLQSPSAMIVIRKFHCSCLVAAATAVAVVLKWTLVELKWTKMSDQMSEYVSRNLVVKRAKYSFFLIPSCGMSTRLISKDLYCSSLKLWSHIEDHATPWYSQFQKERSGQGHLWGSSPGQGFCRLKHIKRYCAHVCAVLSDSLWLHGL